MARIPRGGAILRDSHWLLEKSSPHKEGVSRRQLKLLHTPDSLTASMVLENAEDGMLVAIIYIRANPSRLVRYGIHFFILRDRLSSFFLNYTYTWTECRIKIR